MGNQLAQEFASSPSRRHNQSIDAAKVIRSAPPTIELAGNPAATAFLDDQLVAIRGAAPRSAAVATFEGGEVSVTEADSAPALGKEGKIGPVYRQQGGTLAVPTGRVLIRLPPGDDPQAHSKGLSTAGFKLDEVLPYAPHAAWLRPQDDQPITALGGIDRLRSLPGIEHVELQVLTESATRASAEDDEGPA